MGIFNSTYSKEDFDEQLKIFENNVHVHAKHVKLLKNKCFSDIVNDISDEMSDDFDQTVQKGFRIVTNGVKLNNSCSPENQTYDVQTKELIACNEKLKQINNTIEKKFSKNLNQLLS